ncbi:hypothetical protein KIPB_003816, partial [Kipferlia bialata]
FSNTLTDIQVGESVAFVTQPGRVADVRQVDRLLRRDDTSAFSDHINWVAYDNNYTPVLVWSWQECAQCVQALQAYATADASAFDGVSANISHFERAVLFLTKMKGVTEPAAIKLIARFGSLKAISEASEAELTDVKGIGPKGGASIVHAFHAPFVKADISDTQKAVKTEKTTKKRKGKKKRGSASEASKEEGPKPFISSQEMVALLRDEGTSRVRRKEAGAIRVRTYATKGTTLHVQTVLNDIRQRDAMYAPPDKGVVAKRETKAERERPVTEPQAKRAAQSTVSIPTSAGERASGRESRSSSGVMEDPSFGLSQFRAEAEREGDAVDPYQAGADAGSDSEHTESISFT